MKVCFKCNKKKPLSDFYVHKKMTDGHLGKCKVCTKRDVAENRIANIEVIREYDRIRDKTQKRIDLLTIRSKKYRQKYPERYRANRILNNAKRNGELTEDPCLICGSTKRLVAHHEDYSKPLDVVWLCSVHHSMVHKTWCEA